MSKKVCKKRCHLKTLIFIASVYLIWNIGVTQINIRKQYHQLDIIKQQYNDQLNENKEYQKIISLESAHQYIKRVAREKLAFVSPDDRVFIDISAK